MVIRKSFRKYRARLLFVDEVDLFLCDITFVFILASTRRCFLHSTWLLLSKQLEVLLVQSTRAASDAVTSSRLQVNALEETNEALLSFPEDLFRFSFLPLVEHVVGPIFGGV